MSTRPRGRSACSRKPSERAFPPGTRGSPTRAGPRTARPTPSTRTRTPTVAAPWRWSTTASSRTPARCAPRSGSAVTCSGPTDTEVLAHLVEELIAGAGSMVVAVAGALHQVEGTYGIAVVSTREPDTVVAARRGSPLLVAIGAGENFVASDASAVLSHTRSVVYLDDGEIAVVRPSDYRILDLDTVEKEKAVTRVDWDLATIERGGHAHFMLKEIMEQPESLRNTLRGRLLEEDGTARLGGLNINDE